LPFQNLSGESAQEYLSDGFTEEMIAQLSRVQPERLAVIARTTAMHYKGTDRRLGEIAGELKANYVLVGSVRRSAQVWKTVNRGAPAALVRITAQLIKAGNETHVWSESYDRELSDVLALQSEVAREIARQVQVALTPKEKTRLKRSQQVDAEAYEYYL